jgi:O-acetyl-ADP-ribose deacetylase (regulator of RNase III)
MLRIVQADITTLDVDAIVNAANESLAPGGGVCGAIHRAAGPELAAACAKIGGCPTGSARITPGFRLTAPHVIHSVGPVWNGGASDEDALLASAYRTCFDLAEKFRLGSIAFPAISTGSDGFPLERATAIALREIAAGLGREGSVAEVTCACFDSATLAVYERVRDRLGLEALRQRPPSD